MDQTADPPWSISPETLAQWQREAAALLLLDVREPWELEICRFPGSLDIPLGELTRRSAEVPADRPVVVVCHHGVRSLHATQYLRAHGWRCATNLTGGIDAYARRVEPQMAVY